MPDEERWERKRKLDDMLNKLSIEYFKQKRDMKLDFLRFLGQQESKTPKKISCKISAVKMFLENNQVFFPQRKRKRCCMISFADKDCPFI